MIIFNNKSITYLINIVVMFEIWTFLKEYPSFYNSIFGKSNK